MSCFDTYSSTSRRSRRQRSARAHKLHMRRSDVTLTGFRPGTSGVRASPGIGMKLASHLVLAAVKRPGVFSFSSDNLFFKARKGCTGREMFE